LNDLLDRHGHLHNFGNRDLHRHLHNFLHNLLNRIRNVTLHDAFDRDRHLNLLHHFDHVGDVAVNNLLNRHGHLHCFRYCDLIRNVNPAFNDLVHWVGDFPANYSLHRVRDWSLNHSFHWIWNLNLMGNFDWVIHWNGAGHNAINWNGNPSDDFSHHRVRFFSRNLADEGLRDFIRLANVPLDGHWHVDRLLHHVLDCERNLALHQLFNGIGDTAVANPLHRHRNFDAVRNGDFSGN
jgi:hypothetical protein